MDDAFMTLPTISIDRVKGYLTHRLLVPADFEVKFVAEDNIVYLVDGTIKVLIYKYEWGVLGGATRIFALDLSSTLNTLYGMKYRGNRIYSNINMEENK